MFWTVLKKQTKYHKTVKNGLKEYKEVIWPVFAKKHLLKWKERVSLTLKHREQVKKA